MMLYDDYSDHLYDSDDHCVLLRLCINHDGSLPFHNIHPMITCDLFYIDRVRRIMAAIVTTFRNIGDILLMVIVYVFIFAIMANHLFSDINVQEVLITCDIIDT